MSREPLSIWTIYDHPRDYPENFVARRWENNRPTEDILVGTLDGLRQWMIWHGLTCLTRSPGDDAKIVETWL